LEPSHRASALWHDPRSCKHDAKASVARNRDDDILAIRQFVHLLFARECDIVYEPFSQQHVVGDRFIHSQATLHTRCGR
jgi:hypothetical protein